MLPKVTMRRLFTCAAHSGDAFAPLTSSTVTWASRAVGAVRLGVPLLPPPHAAVIATLSRAASKAAELVRFIGVPRFLLPAPGPGLDVMVPDRKAEENI